MSVSKSDWASLLFGGGAQGARIIPATWQDGGVVVGGEGEAAEASVLSHVGTVDDGERVLCALTGSGALYVLGKVG